jgi:hypothetical protein
MQNKQVMTPKEKAKELVDKFNPLSLRTISDFDTKVPEYKGKECALIAVDEIIKVIPRYEYGQGEKVDSEIYEYYQEVKQEIEKL